MKMKMTVEKATEQGRNAFQTFGNVKLARAGGASNPYNIGTNEWWKWWKGWTDERDGSNSSTEKR